MLPLIARQPIPNHAHRVLIINDELTPSNFQRLAKEMLRCVQGTAIRYAVTQHIWPFKRVATEDIKYQLLEMQELEPFLRRLDELLGQLGGFSA